MKELTFDLTLRDFINKAASSSPTPGGGSIAAVTAALGASMTSMVAHLSTGAKYSDYAEEIQQTIDHALNAIQSFERLMQEDIKAFEAFMSVLKMPKETDLQKSDRSEAMKKALLEATEVPLKIADLGIDTLKKTLYIVNYANKSAISDLGVAAFLVAASIQSVLLTVDINLPMVKDTNIAEHYLERKSEIEKEALLLKDEIISIVSQRIKG